MPTQEKSKLKEELNDKIQSEEVKPKRGRPRKQVSAEDSKDKNETEKKSKSSKSTKSKTEGKKQTTTKTQTNTKKKSTSTKKTKTVKDNLENNSISEDKVEQKEDVKKIESPESKIELEVKIDNSEIQSKIEDNNMEKRKESRMEKELSRLKEETSFGKSVAVKERNNTNIDDDKYKVPDKFATQRVSSIRAELDKGNKKQLELERKIEELKRLNDSYEKRQLEKTNDIQENDNENDINDKIKKKREDRKKKKHGKLFKVIRFFLILGLIGIAILVFLLYGPWNKFRDWYIATAMTTMNHQWLATMFYSQETIDEVLSRNKISEVDDITDNSLIGKNKKTQNNKYANEYEKAVLEKDPKHEDYKIIDIKGKGYNGYLAVVYDASKIHTMITSKLNVAGEYVTTMAKKQGAVLAINGGGFDDPNYSSNGGSPTGITFSRGKLITNRNNTGSVGGIIGFTNDNVLTIGKMSASKAQELGMRDAVTCGPFLIINGKSSEVLGNGGWGDAARTVIGQRQDGIVLMLVLNGRNYATGIIGADMDDLIEIMEKYGAYNAACLDGGTSSVMVENGEILNDPIDGKGRHQTRLIPTAFGVFLDE